MGLHKVFRRGQETLILLALMSLLLAAGCAGMTKPTSGVEPMEVRSDMFTGYLPAQDLPDSLTLLPPPPAPGSVAYAADEGAYRVTRALRGTPRWALATQDADLSFPGGPEAFSCAVDVPITEKVTPRLHRLMGKTLVDAARATYAAKDHYRRVRPFVINKAPTCTPQDEPSLAKNGSYPSGHSSIGWTWALILTEIAPDRTNAVLSRGFAFGESRVICGAHWQSDVAAGRIVASGVVARLHADPEFRTQMEAAGAEIAAVRAKGLKPTRDCREEAEAIAYEKPRTP